MIKFLFVGRLDTPKNPIMLLNVAHKVIQQYPDTEFTIVGDGEKYEDCKRFIDKNNLSDNIRLEGWQNDVSPYYKDCDIFIMTSIYEAFGLIFLEAGYNKLPTIATNVEGIPEVVLHGKTGLLSDLNDVDAMTKNALFLIEHPDIRSVMGNNAYEYVTHNFSSEIMVGKYRDLYERSI